MHYTCVVHPMNRKGSCEGELIGGNLSLLAHLMGSSSEINTKGKILFLEDVGEYLYNIDRMLIQLKRSGKLSSLAGLIIGGFTELKDTTTHFGQDVYNIIIDKVKEYNYPVCFDFPVSHTDRNYALKVGVKHRLSVSDKKVLLKDVTS